MDLNNVVRRWCWILLSFLTVITFVWMLAGCSASSLGDQTIQSGAFTVHEPCPDCLFIQTTAHVEVYPDEGFFDNVSQFVKGWSPAAIGGAVVTSPLAGTVESVTGEKRWEINVFVRVPGEVAKEMSTTEIERSIRQAVKSIEAKRLKAIQNPSG